MVVETVDLRQERIRVRDGAEFALRRGIHVGEGTPSNRHVRGEILSTGLSTRGIKHGDFDRRTERRSVGETDGKHRIDQVREW